MFWGYELMVACVGLGQMGGCCRLLLVDLVVLRLVGWRRRLGCLVGELGVASRGL